MTHGDDASASGFLQKETEGKTESVGSRPSSNPELNDEILRLQAEQKVLQESINEMLERMHTQAKPAPQQAVDGSAVPPEPWATFAPTIAQPTSPKEPPAACWHIQYPRLNDLVLPLTPGASQTP